MARQAVFNWLQSRISFSGLRAADICFGSGSMGLEFWSRGGGHVTFVDHHLGVVHTLKERIVEWRVEGVEVLRMDMYTWLGIQNVGYDIIFCDPPYVQSELDKGKWVSDCLRLGFLNSGGYLVYEHSDELSIEVQGVVGYIETRKYGSVNFSFFGKQ
jgi:16S rRNA (guanine966-N2)-methyltransferase